MALRYRAPQDVVSPRDFVSNVNVLYDGGVNDISIAQLDWDGDTCLAIRWNVAAREQNDPDKLAGNKECLGMPISTGYPVWFVVPRDFLNKNSELWDKVDEALKKIEE